MGLTTWKNSPKGRILKSDVIVAKNYLQEKEIKELELAVSAFFDYIENIIRRRNTFNIEQFAGSVTNFLSFMDYQILPDKGRISAAQAKAKAKAEQECCFRLGFLGSDTQAIALVGSDGKVFPLKIENIADT